MEDLLEHLTMEHLNDNHRELAEIIGIEAFRKLVKTYSGTSSLYVPQEDKLVKPIRDKLICKEFGEGKTVRQLSVQWKMTERAIYKIIKQHREDINV